jgi:hypothetical protein
MSPKDNRLSLKGMINLPFQCLLSKFLVLSLGDKSQGGTGQGDGQQGDPVDGQPDPNGQPGEGEAGEGEGNKELDVEMSLDELASIWVKN